MLSLCLFLSVSTPLTCAFTDEQPPGGMFQQKPGQPPSKVERDLRAYLARERVLRPARDRYLNAAAAWLKLIREESAADAPRRPALKKEIERIRKEADEAYEVYRKLVEPDPVRRQQQEDKARREVLQKLQSDAAARVKELDGQLAAAEKDSTKTDARRAVLEARLDEARRHEKQIAADLADLTGPKPKQ